MSETIEVLGVEAKQRDGSYQARTPLGLVLVRRHVGYGWCVLWRPQGARSRGTRSMGVHLLEDAGSPADAAREATRRLRAIQRVCARAGAL